MPLAARAQENAVNTTGWNQNLERRTRHAASGGIVIAPSESEVHALTDLLSELHDLLDEYAPAWYSEDLHNRIEATLRSVRSR